MLAKSLNCPSFAGDVKVPVRSGEDQVGQRLGGRGDRDVGWYRRSFGGERPVLAVVFGQIVPAVEPEVPAGWLAVVGGEVDGLDGRAEQVLGVQRLAGLGPAPGVP